jgi:hypothetical protein
MTRKDMISLSIYHREFPVKDKREAVTFIEQQRTYLQLLTENFPNSPVSEACRTSIVIGDMKETDKYVTFLALDWTDRYGKPTACEQLSVDPPVWDFYSYCHGDQKIVNLKINKVHMPEFEEVSLCD